MKESLNIFSLFCIFLSAQLFSETLILNPKQILSVETGDLYQSQILIENGIITKIAKDLSKKSKMYSSLSNILGISHSSVISSTLLSSLDDCLLLTEKYYIQNELNKKRYNNILNVHYEELINNPEAVIKEILDFCKINYNDDLNKSFINTIDNTILNKYDKINVEYSKNILDKINY